MKRNLCILLVSIISISGCATTKNLIGPINKIYVSSPFASKEELKAMMDEKAKEVCGTDNFVYENSDHSRSSNTVYAQGAGFFQVSSGHYEATVNCDPDDDTYTIKVM